MIKANKGMTSLEGERGLILEEYSTIVVALLSAGFKKEEVKRAFDKAIETFRKFPREFNNINRNNVKCKNYRIKGEEGIDEILKEIIASIEEEIRNEKIGGKNNEYNRS